MIDDGPILPAELQNLTGVGKTILIERRKLVRLGLIHKDDEAYPYSVTLRAQMETLQRRATVELRNNR